MRPISRAATIRRLDAAWIERLGLPSAVLMEHAGHLVADELLRRHGKARYVVVCGPGNNGGDGYVIARHLHIAGAPVRVVPLFPPRSPDAVLFHGVVTRLGLLGEVADVAAAELAVDCVFGTGQRAPVEVPALPTGPRWVAVDVPTGIDADTGAALCPPGRAFPTPEHVVTIGRLKPFLFAGGVSWSFVDIGLEQAAAATGEGAAGAGAAGDEAAPDAWLVDAPPLPKVRSNANKWDRGHVGVLAGSGEKAGAGVLAATGALRGGAGLVTLFTPRTAWGRLHALPPEVMVEDLVATEGGFGGLDRCDVLVAGPGLGRSVDGSLRTLWAGDRRPLVYDADALRCGIAPFASGPRLLTPHPGEASALLGRPWAELEGDRLATARALAAWGAVLYKGACPIVAEEQGAWVLQGDVPALGTGGSGDVLAGLCGAMLAQGAAPRDAALAAAWLHLAAGRRVPLGAGAREVADLVPLCRNEADRRP